MRAQTQHMRRYATAILAGTLLATAAPLRAGTATWTNYNGSGSLSDYWTNNASWNPVGQPGTGAGESAYLTNQVGLAYTNVLNFKLANAISTLAISNALGEAWLVITNTTLTNATAGAFVLGSGGRLQIDNGGGFTQQSNASFTWVGTNGTLWLNNGGNLFTALGVTIGHNLSSVTGLVTSVSATGGIWNLNNQALIFSNRFNILTINNATLTNVSVLTLGSGAGTSNFGNTLVVSNGSQLFLGASISVIGTGGSSNNTLIINGGAQASPLSTLVSNASAQFIIGNAASSGNAVSLSNATLFTSSTFIGDGSSNNSVTVSGSATWMLRTGTISLGTGTGNVVTVNNGGSVINVGGLAFSGNNNSVIVSNGGILSGAGAITFDPAGYGNTITLGGGAWALGANNLTVGGGANSSNNAFNIVGGVVSSSTENVLGVGTAAGANFNSVIVTNGGSLLLTNILSGGTTHVLVGSADGGGTGGNNNTVIASNSVLVSGTDDKSYVGSSSSSNSVTLLAGTTWRISGNGAGQLTIGLGAATGNVVTVNGGIITNGQGGGLMNNPPSLIVGSGAGSVGNALIVTNGGQILAAGNGGSITIGTGGSSSNVFIINGGSQASPLSTVVSNSNAFVIGDVGSGYNSLSITNAKLYTINGVTIGNSSSNNTATVSANALWNAGGGVALTVGTGAAAGNVLTINGGLLTNVLGLTIGATAGANGNTVTISNGGQVWSTANSAIGNAAGANSNTVALNGAGSLWNLGGTKLTIGTGAATGNVLTVNAGSVSNISTLTIGSGVNAFANSLTITNGGGVFATAVLVGTAAGGNNNSLLINSGGLLEANSLSNFMGGTGNTISNVGGVYQFTQASPVIATNGPGDIAITDGTISFRALATADVTNNLGRGALSGIAFAGADTFQLNAASNLVAGQTYTFQAVPGNPSNYVNLAMINGATAYRGGNLTIGSTGTLLVSNTTAAITGLFTNQGTTRVVNASAAFGNGIVNAGVLALQQGTVLGAVTNLSSGTLEGNGLVQGNVTSFGTITPGFSVGTLSITGNLTLASSAVTVMELAGVGSNDIVNVSQLFTYAGQLVVTNSTGFTFASGESFQLFNFGSQAGNFGVTNLPNLSTGLVWDTSKLDSQGLISVIIPEPSTVVLLAGGLLLLVALIKRPVRS